MSDDKKTLDHSEDQELNDLLDNALEDFDKEPKFKPKNEEESSTSVFTSNEEPIEATLTDDKWTKDFIQQATDQFEKNWQDMMKNGPDDLKMLQKAAQAVASAFADNENSEGDEATADFQSAISQALKDLSTTSENLQNASAGLNESEIASMLGQTSLEEGASDVVPFIQSIMQSLLSKEVLYPALKDLIDKYPEWLEKNKTKLSPADSKRYSKQLDLLQKACVELEKEKDDDSEDSKRSRFDTILLLMQEIQGCGLPPEELVGEQPNLFQCDADGNPIIPSIPGIDSPQNCCVM